MHGCLIRQYRIGGFWAKNYAMRKKCLTYPRMVKMMKKLNNPEYIHYLNEKVDFNQYLKDFMNQGRWLNYNPLGEQWWLPLHLRKWYDFNEWDDYCHRSALKKFMTKWIGL